MRKKFFISGMITILTLLATVPVRAEEVLDCSGWRVAHSKGYRVDDTELLLSFKSTTYADATHRYDIPMYVVYTADEEYQGGSGFSDIVGYEEIFVMRADNFGWSGANNTGSYLEGLLDAGFVVGQSTGVPADDAEWVAWLEGCKAGTDCTLKATPGDGNIEVSFTVNGLTSNMTIPVEEGKDVYLSISGELCTISNMNVVERELLPVSEAEKMQQAAIDLLLEEGMIKSKFSAVMFSDCNMDGILELYYYPETNITGSYPSYDIYYYEDGKYIEKDTPRGLKISDADSLYMNMNGEYILIMKAGELVGSAYPTFLYYKYDVQTEESSLIAYYEQNMMEYTVNYYSGADEEITQEQFYQLLENATEGYEKVKRHRKGVSIYKGMHIEKAVKESWYGYYIGDREEKVLTIKGTASISEVESGKKVTLTGMAEGGVGDYTYSYLVYNQTTDEWTRLTPSFIENNTITWTAGDVGKRKFYIEVKDGYGDVVRSSALSVTVTNPALTVTGETSVSEVTKGDKVTLTGMAAGGDGNYTYSYMIHNRTTGEWARLMSSFTESDVFTWTAGSAGTRDFYVEVKDGTGKVARSKAMTVDVQNAKLCINGKTSADTVTKGKKVILTGIANGGDGNYTYRYLVYNYVTGEWANLTSSFIKNSTFTWTAGSTGMRIFYVEVKDGTGEIVRSTPILVNVQDAKQPLAITGKTSIAVANKGAKITLTGAATGGDGNYTYSYLVYNSTTNQWARLTSSFTKNSSFTWTAGSAGNRKFYVEVKDGTGKVVRSSAIAVTVK